MGKHFAHNRSLTGEYVSKGKDEALARSAAEDKDAVAQAARSIRGREPLACANGMIFMFAPENDQCVFEERGERRDERRGMRGKEREESIERECGRLPEYLRTGIMPERKSYPWAC